MLRACAHAAATTGALCLFLEPIALYHTRDLYEDGDGAWLSADTDDIGAAIGTARTHGDGTDLTVAHFANGVPMSLRVAHRLRRSHGIHTRVTDLRWLSPLPVEDILRAATRRGVSSSSTRHGAVAGSDNTSSLPSSRTDSTAI